ncbi:MAG TPA: nucleotidyltransferase family protein, partial [Usitatibacter sp.]|nr:nucleotidyltransferase family protein [Usitatibacter sp.]
ADIRGLLLCGGASTRFGANKLLALAPVSATAPARAAQPIASLAAQNLLAGVNRALAVIRPGESALRSVLEEAGCEVLEEARARYGIGESLACAVAATREAAGWVVSLGDMPFVRAATIRAVRSQLELGATIAAPLNPLTGQRGHPVGFSCTLMEELLALRGDEGARAVIERHHHELVPVPVDDPGIFFDVDTPEDLARAPRRA